MGVAPWRGVGTVSLRWFLPASGSLLTHVPIGTRSGALLGGPLFSGLCPGNSGPLGLSGLPFCLPFRLPFPAFSSLHLGLPFLHHRWEPLRLGFAALCCRVSSVLDILVSFLQSSFLAASGGWGNQFLSLSWLDMDLVLRFGVKVEMRRGRDSLYAAPPPPTWVGSARDREGNGFKVMTALCTAGHLEAITSP